MPEAAPLDPPRSLSGEARRKWLETAPVLSDAGLLAVVDRDALLSYCRAWARWIEAEKAIEQLGMVIASPSGYPQQSPYVAIADRAWAKMQAFWGDFGMNPSARTRISGTVSSGGGSGRKHNKLERFLALQTQARSAS